MQFAILILAFLFSLNSFSREVFVFIQSDDAVTQHKQSIADFQSYILKIYERNEHSQEPKIVIATLSSVESIQELENSIRSQIDRGDVIRSMIISAHGSDKLIAFNAQNELIDGRQAGELFYRVIASQVLHPKMSVYLWSCNNGCNLEQKSSFLDDFSLEFSKRVYESHPDVTRIDVIGHMFFGHRDGETLFKKLSAFSVISFNTGLVRSAVRAFKKIGRSEKIQSLLTQNKTLRTILLGDQFTKPFAIPMLTFGFGTFFTSLILFSNQHISEGWSVLSAGIGLSITGRFVFKEFPRALHQYVRMVSTKGSLQTEELGYLSQMYQRVLAEKVSSCSHFYIR